MQNIVQNLIWSWTLKVVFLLKKLEAIFSSHGKILKNKEVHIYKPVKNKSLKKSQYFFSKHFNKNSFFFYS